MSLSRTIAKAALLAGSLCAAATALPTIASAAEDQDVATQGRVIPLPLQVRSGAMTEGEASDMLKAEGYEVVQSGRTLLGRIRIVADGPQGRREIVLHPGDGRVLRDITTEAAPSQTAGGGAAAVAPAAPLTAEPMAVGTAPQTSPAAGVAAPAPASSAPAPTLPAAPTPASPQEASASAGVDRGEGGPAPEAAARAHEAAEGAGL